MLMSVYEIQTAAKECPELLGQVFEKCGITYEFEKLGKNKLAGQAGDEIDQWIVSRIPQPKDPDGGDILGAIGVLLEPVTKKVSALSLNNMLSLIEQNRDLILTGKGQPITVPEAANDDISWKFEKLLVALDVAEEYGRQHEGKKSHEPQGKKPSAAEDGKQPMVGKAVQMGVAITSALGGTATLMSIKKEDKGWRKWGKILAGAALAGLGVFVGYKALKDPAWVDRIGKSFGARERN